MTRFRAFAPVAAVAVLIASLLAVPAHAQAKPQAPRQAAQPSQPVSPSGPAIVVENQNVDETRDALMEVLKRYPPALGRMLKLDPGLMSNQAYMSAYPVLGQFLQQHPDVARNPSYFFERVRESGPTAYYAQDTETSTRVRAIEMWRGIMGDFLFLVGFLGVITAITWVIKSIVDHRRWSRLSKVQAEVHNKLIDRLASNDEMLAYIQSPAGAGFLKAGPAAAGNGAKSMHAPFGRILWSAQAGVVLLALGLGLRWVTVTAPVEVVEMLRFLGIIGQALGVGFLVSAGLSYVISRRMGLIDPATPAISTERDTPSRS